MKEAEAMDVILQSARMLPMDPEKVKEPVVDPLMESALMAPMVPDEKFYPPGFVGPKEPKRFDPKLYSYRYQLAKYMMRLRTRKAERRFGCQMRMASQCPSTSLAQRNAQA
jgi:hypothetical protein